MIITRCWALTICQIWRPNRLVSENDSSVLSELRGLASTKVVIISQQFRFGKKQLAVLSSAEPCSSVQLITVRTLEAGVSVNQTGWRVICKKKNFARWPLYGPSHCKNSLTSCNATVGYSNGDFRKCTTPQTKITKTYSFCVFKNVFFI